MRAEPTILIVAGGNDPQAFLCIAPMQRRINTEVIIVGAGPVGLSLAMDLARRSVGVTLVEMRAAGEPPSVRCNHVSARTMEAFRRLGIARAVRDGGLPADYPNDVVFRTTATGIDMARIPIPSRAERYRAKKIRGLRGIEWANLGYEGARKLCIS